MSMDTVVAYVPRPSGIADRCLTYLATVPDGVATISELADAVDSDEGSLYGSLSYAEKHGLVHRDRFNGVTRWALLATGEQTDEDVTEPESVAAVANDFAIPRFGKPAEPWPPESVTAAPIADPVEVPGRPAFACARFNDGRLLIELDGGEYSLRLSAEQAATLTAYLLSPPLV